MPEKFAAMTRDEYLNLNILDKLQFWIDFPKGGFLDHTWDHVNKWDDLVREVCQAAKDEIEVHIGRPYYKKTLQPGETIVSLREVKIEPTDDLAAIKRKIRGQP